MVVWWAWVSFGAWQQETERTASQPMWCGILRPQPKPFAEGGIAQMDLLELLPEESWTAEYKKGQDVWVKATVRKAREGCLDVSVFGSPFYSNIYSPSIIKKV